MKIKTTKVLALFMGLSGVGVIAFILAPIISYEITARQKFPKLISPVPQNYTLGQNLFKNYKDPKNWFVDNNTSAPGVVKKSSYLINVPKLKIKDAVVSLGGEDLAESLIQYPGTALPGETGNTVIFGHSVLPVFFNPENYLTIFSTLPKLEKNDEVDVDYDGIIYNYKVVAMFEASPSDIQVLEQSEDGSYLTLVTCVPPGHPLSPKRLIIRAKLVPV
jgi:sortase A